MNKEPHNHERRKYIDRIGAQAARKLKAQRKGVQSVWFGLGMLGLIGWSVTLPTLGGALLGLWLDKHVPGAHSWTLALLVLGLTVGCFNAWHWITREQHEIHKDLDDPDP